MGATLHAPAMPAVPGGEAPRARRAAYLRLLRRVAVPLPRTTVGERHGDEVSAEAFEATTIYRDQLDGVALEMDRHRVTMIPSRRLLRSEARAASTFQC